MGSILKSVIGIEEGAGQQQAGQAAANFSGISLPDLESMKLDLQQQVSQGLISPEEAVLAH